MRIGGRRMDDLINRQHAIDALTDRSHQSAKKDGVDSSLWEGIMIARRIVKNLPSAQPELDSEALIRTIEMGITAINLNDVYSLGMRNGMRWCKSLIDGVEPKFEDYVTSVDDWKELPSAQPEEAISVSWIEGQIERLNNMDNYFAKLTADIIKTMLNEWSKRRTDDKERGDNK